MPMRILIAEDDPYSLMILRLMLEKEPGWEVVSVNNGRDAWEQLLNSPVFDVCIFDIMMPEMDGLQLAGRMRSDPRFEDQPLIFCTALNDRGTVEQAALLSASHYITKPYRRDQIIRQVRRAAASRAACGRIESGAKVAERLGLEVTDIREMRAGLREAVATLVQELGNGFAAMKTDACAIRINGLKGAAANLGARRLAEELARLESLRGSPDRPMDFEWMPALQRVGTECEHLRRCLASDNSVLEPAPAG